MRPSTTSPTSPARVRHRSNSGSARETDGMSGSILHADLPSEASWQMCVHLCYITPRGHSETRTRPDNAGITGREAMKHKKREGCSKRTVACMQETVLRQLVKVAGLQEMTIWRNRNNGWHLSVTVKSGPHVLYLSTRRAPRSPRAFTRLEAALAAGQRIRATQQVTLVLR